MKHILDHKEPDHVWDVSDVLHVALADDVRFLVKAANDYKRLRHVEALARVVVKQAVDGGRTSLIRGADILALRDALDATPD